MVGAADSHEHRRQRAFSSGFPRRVSSSLFSLSLFFFLPFRRLEHGRFFPSLFVPSTKGPRTLINSLFLEENENRPPSDSRFNDAQTSRDRLLDNFIEKRGKTEKRRTNSSLSRNFLNELQGSSELSVTRLLKFAKAVEVFESFAESFYDSSYGKIITIIIMQYRCFYRLLLI